jgi:hypothetical protein
MHAAAIQIRTMHPPTYPPPPSQISLLVLCFYLYLLLIPWTFHLWPILGCPTSLFLQIPTILPPPPFSMGYISTTYFLHWQLLQVGIQHPCPTGQLPASSLATPPFFSYSPSSNHIPSLRSPMSFFSRSSSIHHPPLRNYQFLNKQN